MRRLPCVLVLFLLPFPLFAQEGPNAADLVAGGQKLIAGKKVPEALEAFRQATEKDPGSAEAHYQLARAYALLRAQKKVCEYDAYRSTVIEQLDAAIRLDEKLASRLKKDKDFVVVQDTFGFQRLIGLSAQEERDLPVILQRVTWYGPCPGAYGPSGGLKFLPRGKLETWTLDPPEGGPAKKVKGIGTWKIEDGKILLKIGKEKTVQEGTLSSTGQLEFNAEGFGPYSDDPCECEA